jgi:methionine-rich copper-binding protein CopC
MEDVMSRDADGGTRARRWHITRPCAALLSLLGVLGVPQGALAHAVLLESTPGTSEAVSEAGSLDLRFNSRLEPAFAQIRLARPSGEAAPLRVGLSRVAPNRLTAALPALDPGVYTVHWRVLTVDGHVNHGSFSFRIAPPSP